MPITRQNLISQSPFLSGQRERIGGGMSVKRSTITGAAFKKGTTQETLGKVGGKESDKGKLARILRDTRRRVLGNQKKITLLKNIIKARRMNIGEKLPGSEQSIGRGGTLRDTVSAIASTVDSIRDTLIGRERFDMAQAEDDRKRAEQEERSQQEKDAEKEKFKGLKKATDKILAPVKSIWGHIWKFISTIFLGKVLLGFLDWFADKKNQKKITSLVKFVKTWWPALVASILLFGTGFGGLVAGLVGAAMAAVPALIAAGIALKGFIAANPLAASIATGVVLGTGAAVASRMSKGDDKEGVTKEFNEGGFVSGPEGTDRVPAKLTAGEFVMSKGAVEKYGVDTLAGMNAAAGGTNRPTRGRYQTGGEVTQDNAALIDRLHSQYPEMSREEIRISVENEQAKINKRDSQRNELHPLLSKPQLGSRPGAMDGENDTGTEIDLNSLGTQILGQNPNKPILSENNNPNLTAETVGSQGPNIVKPKEDVQISPKQKTRSAEGISKSPKPKNAVVAYNAAKAEGVNAEKNSASGGGGGNSIPSFDAGLMRDPSKIKTLGIMIL